MGKVTNRAEQAFLESYDPADFERLSLAVDVALIMLSDRRLKVLLVRRREHPDRDKWALPGTFVQPQESLDHAAARCLRAKTGLERIFLEQLYSFGAPARDPRTRVVTVAHFALVDPAALEWIDTRDDDLILAGIQVPWPGEAGGPVTLTDQHNKPLAMAFDHGEIIALAVKRLRGKLNYTPVGFELLPELFTLRALQDVHEAILGRALNKDSFRRRLLASGLIQATKKRELAVGHRPAALYRFVRSREAHQP